MDLITNSNNNSVILRSLAKSKTNNSYLYSMKPPSPNAATGNLPSVLTPDEANFVEGGEIRTKIRQNDLFTNGMYQLDLTYKNAGNVPTPILSAALTDGDDNLQYDFGNRVVEECRVECKGVVLFRMSGFAMKCRTVFEEAGKSLEHQNLAIPRTTTTAETPVLPNVATSFRVYVKLFDPSFESTMTCWLLNQTQQLEVILKLATYANSKVVENVSLGNCSAKFIMWSTHVDPLYQPVMIEKDYSAGTVKSRLMVNYDTVPFPLLGTEGTTCVRRLTSNYICKRMFYGIVNVQSDRDIATCQVTPYAKIYTSQFEIGGTVIIGSNVGFRGVMSLFGSEKGARSRIALGYTNNASTVLNFKFEDSLVNCIEFCDDPANLTYSSGGCAFGSLNYPSLTLTYNTLGTPADNRLMVAMEYYQMVSIDNSNGQISIASSS